MEQKILDALANLGYKFVYTDETDEINETKYYFIYPNGELRSATAEGILNHNIDVEIYKKKKLKSYVL